MRTLRPQNDKNLTITLTQTPAPIGRGISLPHIHSILDSIKSTLLCSLIYGLHVIPYHSIPSRRPCSDFMDMLRRLINYRIIIIIIIIHTPASSIPALSTLDLPPSPHPNPGFIAGRAGEEIDFGGRLRDRAHGSAAPALSRWASRCPVSTRSHARLLTLRSSSSSSSLSCR